MPSTSVSPMFCDLSDEVLLTLCSYAKPKELGRLRQTCRRFRNLISEPKIWEKRLSEDYGFNTESDWNNWTAEDIYKAVHKFRELLGFWYCDLPPFGLLVLIKVEKDGVIVYECAPPVDPYFLEVDGIDSHVTVNPDVDYNDSEQFHHFRFRRLFGITPTVDTSTSSLAKPLHSLRFVCYQYSIDAHPAQENGCLLCVGCNESDPATCNGSMGMDANGDSAPKYCFQTTEDGFDFRCINRANHGPHDLKFWLEWEHGFRLSNDDEATLDTVLSSLREQKDYDLRLEKFEARSSTDNYCLTRRIDHLISPSTQPVAACPPGLYFGHFNWHGWEALNLYYTNDGRILIGEKVTGDQMIPVGKTSFRVDTSQRIHLTFEDLASMASVRAAVKRFSATQRVNNGVANMAPATTELPTRPFRLPSDCAILGARSVPDQCLTFFMGEGQIAFPNFMNPRYMPCIFIIFDHTKIGLLWLDLRCLLPMYKIVNPNCS